MAKKSPLLVWAEYIPVRLTLALLTALPRNVALPISIGLARFFYIITGGREKIAMTNLGIAFPELSLEDRKKLLKRSFDSLGRVLGEVSQFPKASRAKIAALVDYDFDTAESLSSAERQRFDEARAAGRGVILVSPHLGNWELGVFAYSATREPLTYLARPLDNPKIEKLIAVIRSRFGNRAINKTNSVTAAFEILRSGGMLGVLPDVNVQEKDGIFVPFFGVPACTTRGIAMLAMRTNAMIIPTCCVWDERRKKYIGKYGKQIDPQMTADRNAEIYRITLEMTAEIERFIRASPDQWIWTHKRWKTRPPGEPDIY